MSRFICVVLLICISAAMGDVYLRRPRFRRPSLSSARASAAAHASSDSLGGLGSSNAHASAQSSASSFGDGFSNANAQASANAVSQSRRRQPFFNDLLQPFGRFNRRPLRRRGGCECEYDGDCDYGYCRRSLRRGCGYCENESRRRGLW